MLELPNSLIEVLENAAESFSDKPLKVQLVHELDEAKPGEQED